MLLLTAFVTISIRVLLVQNAQSLRINFGGNNDTLAVGIMEVLKGSGKMIVIDEAQFLTLNCLEILRQIHDEAGIGWSAPECRGFTRRLIKNFKATCHIAKGERSRPKPSKRPKHR